MFLFNPQNYSKSRHGFRVGGKKVLSTGNSNEIVIYWLDADVDFEVRTVIS